MRERVRVSAFGNLDTARFRFLYRESEGVISGREWAMASVGPVGIALVLTAIAFAIAPDAPRDLTREAFIDPLTVARHAYLIVYAFALILCAVAEYFVSAKRFADRGRPPALAGLAPFSLLIAGAAYWYQPRSEGTMPEGLVYAFAALAVAVLAWNVIELGFGASRRR
jgi:drug/metabolite transporter (DMT)-like permease